MIRSSSSKTFENIIWRFTNLCINNLWIEFNTARLSFCNKGLNATRTKAGDWYCNDIFVMFLEHIYLRKLSCKASLRHQFFRNESIFLMGILPYKLGIGNFLFTYHKPKSIYVPFKFKTTRCFSAVSTTVISCHYGNSISLNSQLLPHILHFLKC